MSAGAWEHATRECQGGRWSGVARTFLYLNLANWIEPQFFDCTRLKVEVSAPSQVQGPTSKAKAQEPRLFNGEGRGLDSGWCTHNAICRRCIIELYT